MAIGFLVFTGIGASSWWLAARTQARRRRNPAVDWLGVLDMLDAFEGTPPLGAERAVSRSGAHARPSFSRPSEARLRRPRSSRAG